MVIIRNHVSPIITLSSLLTVSLLPSSNVPLMTLLNHPEEARLRGRLKVNFVKNFGKIREKAIKIIDDADNRYPGLYQVRISPGRL